MITYAFYRKARFKKCNTTAEAEATVESTPLLYKNVNKDNARPNKPRPVKRKYASTRLE
jgi:hypothetical protein